MIKKQLIMEKALELFAKQGFEATTIQQITSHCAISKGAFYLSFKSKDELIISLIDHFMIQITSDIDYIVKHTNNDEELLYAFYYTTFNFFDKHSDFAKIFIKEQTQTFNEEFINKMRYYDRRFQKIILSMLDRLYGDKVTYIKYDLNYCIKGFMGTYFELFLFSNVSVDLNLMSKSLVEKTNLLASHTTIPFITEEYTQKCTLPLNEEITKKQILEVMEQKIEEIKEPIEKESLILLKQHLIKPTLNLAIVKGLQENIRNHPQCKWISYLLRTTYGF